MVPIGLIRSIHQAVFSEFFIKSKGTLVHIRMFQGVPLIRHLVLTSVSDKHIYLSILCIFKQRPHWSVLMTVVLSRLELYLVWWTNSNADQVSYLDLILI